MSKERQPLKELQDVIIQGFQEKKGKDITLLDLRGIRDRVADFFVICQAESTTQVKALADSAEEEVKLQLQERPFSVEGRENASWILLDYGHVVAHVFQPQAREFYALEELWNDAIRTVID
jgi:ribosome-associated protein